MTIGFEVFLLALVAASGFTGLFTEAVKIVFNELGINYSANVLAGIVAVIVMVAICAGGCTMFDITINNKVIVTAIGLTAFSWLGAMVGYDKVLQAIKQIKMLKR